MIISPFLSHLSTRVPHRFLIHRPKSTRHLKLHWYRKAIEGTPSESLHCFIRNTGLVVWQCYKGGAGAAVNAWLEPLALQRELMPGVYPGQVCVAFFIVAFACSYRFYIGAVVE